MNIVEFLSICNSAQSVLRLSEEEFLECLLGAVTGPAHAHMLAWLEQGEDVSSVYHLLALHYDSRLTALYSMLGSSLTATGSPKAQILLMESLTSWI